MHLLLEREWGVRAGNGGFPSKLHLFQFGPEPDLPTSSVWLSFGEVTVCYLIFYPFMLVASFSSNKKPVRRTLPNIIYAIVIPVKTYQIRPRGIK